MSKEDETTSSMELKRFFVSKFVGLLGIIGPIIAISLILISIALSPWFSWQDNALSDLGVSSAAILFNTGLIICGVFCTIFSVGFLISIDEKKWFRRIGSVLLCLATIALIGIGVFSEDFGVLHLYFSIAFFTLLLTASILLGVSMIVDPELKTMGILIFLVGVIGILSWVFSKAEGVAIPEALSSFPAYIWFAILGVRMYRSISKESKRRISCRKG
jgi:hypothetical membrane protein